MCCICQKSITICLNQPALRDTIWRPRGRQRGDRDTNQGLDKSQHAKQRKHCSPWLWEGCKLEFFYLEWCLYPRLSPGESPVMFASMKVGWPAEWPTGWQKEPVVWQQQPIWQRRPRHLDPVCCKHTQPGLTLPRGISALWFPLPWPALIVIPHSVVKGGGMNHTLLQRNDISCSERNPPLPHISADKGNEFRTRLKYKHLSSRRVSLRFGPCLSETTSDAKKRGWAKVGADSMTVLKKKADL